MKAWIWQAADEVARQDMLSERELNDFIVGNLESGDSERVFTLLERNVPLRDLVLEERKRFRRDYPVKVLVRGAGGVVSAYGRKEDGRMAADTADASPPTLAALDCAVNAAADTESQHAVFGRLVNPVNGDWLRYCRAIAHGKVERSSGEMLQSFFELVLLRYEAIGCGDRWRAHAMLMHECAVALADADRVHEEVNWAELAARSGVEERRVREMGAWIDGRLRTSPKEGPRVITEQPMTVVLIDCKDKGHCATLHLELLDGGTQKLVASPEMGLVPMDEKFRDALTSAEALAGKHGAWKGGREVRWRLTMSEGKDVSVLAGGSLGMALTFGLLRVTSPAALADYMARLEKEHSFICCIGSDRADHVVAKVKALLEHSSVRLVVAASDAEDEIVAEWPTARTWHSERTFAIPDPNGKGELRVILAEILTEEKPAHDGVAEVLKAILVEQHLEFPFPWWDRVRGLSRDAQRREWMDEWVEHSLNRKGSRITLIEGIVGAGKTTYMRMLLDAKKDERPVAHFIEGGREGEASQPPEVFLRSLCCQVCRKYALPLPSSGQSGKSNLTARDAARQLVEQLIKARANSEKPEVLYIDALDHAYGPGAWDSGQAGVLPELITAINELDRNWDSVRILATSRWEASDKNSRLKNLRLDEESHMKMGDDKFQGDVIKDLSTYLRMHGLSRSEAETAAEDAAGSFLFARLFSKDVEPSKSIDELIDNLFERAVESLEKRCALDSIAARVRLIDALGLLAVAREPLSRCMFRTLMGAEREEAARDAVTVLPMLFEGGALDGEDRVVRWVHDYVPRFIRACAHGWKRSDHIRAALDHLEPEASVTAVGGPMRYWHGLWGDAAQKWRDCSRGGARDYAVSHLLVHLRKAGRWDQFEKVFCDPEYLQAKLSRPMGFRYLRKNLARAMAERPPETGDFRWHEILGVIRDVLVPLNGSDANVWLHVFQEIYNESPKSLRESAPDAYNGFYQTIMRELTAAETLHAWLKSLRDGTHLRPPGEPLLHPCNVPSAAFSRAKSSDDQWYLATMGADYMLRLWKQSSKTPLIVEMDLLTPGERQKHDVHHPDGAPPKGVIFVPGARFNLVALGRRLCFINYDFEDPSHEFECEFGNGTAHMHALGAPSQTELPIFGVSLENGTVRIFDADMPMHPVAELFNKRPSGWKKDRKERGVAADSPDAVPNDYCPIAFSPDGKRVAVGQPDWAIHIWELDIDLYREDRARQLREIAAMSRRGRAKRKDTTDPNEGQPLILKGTLICVLPPPDRRPDSLAFSPDGSILAVGGGFERGLLELWDLETMHCSIHEAHQNAIWAIEWLTRRHPTGAETKPASRDDWMIVTGSHDRTIALWAWRAMSSAAKIDKSWTCVGISPDERIRSTFQMSDRVRSAPLAVRSVGDAVMSIAVSPDQTRIVTSGVDRVALIWSVPTMLAPDLTKGTEIRDLHGNVYHASAFTPDGHFFATGSQDGWVRLWNRESKKVGEPVSFGSRCPVQALRFSPDGRMLLIGLANGDAVCCFYDEDYREIDRVIISGRDPVTAVEFHPSGSGEFAFAIADASGRIRVFRNPQDQQPLDLHGCHKDKVRCLSFSTNASVLASGSNDQSAVIWDLTTGESVMHLKKAHNGRIKSCAFSPDGQWLATGGQFHVKIWNTATWQIAHVFAAHADEVWTLRWSPCGRLLASGGKDRSLVLWRIMAGDSQDDRQVAHLPCAGAVLAVWFSQDFREMLVTDPGPERRLPNCSVIEVRGNTGVPPLQLEESDAS